VARAKTERLLNLVICLKATRRFLTVAEIREKVPGYESDTEEAFRRMFERDKKELRELGIPLETGSESGWGDDEGYRIARGDYALPDVNLAPDEAAAVALAARLWQHAPLAGATGSALLKLRAAGVEGTESPEGLEPRIGVTEEAFESAWRAVRDGYRVRFSYRAAGRGEVETRDVEPWGIVSWRGRWYLVGHDLTRRAERVFRLSRIQGGVQPYGDPHAVQRPEGVDLRATVSRLAHEMPSAVAQVRVRAGHAWELRRSAGSTTPDGDGWDLLEIGYSDPERMAERITAFGPDAVAVAPPELREAVVRRLTALVGA
jgi:proteasome accessory factor B